MSAVRVRFAPSPTGPLHIGGARSALFNWLYARRYGGTFIVRIEDTDLARSSRESEENILAALKWMGLDWDEGVGIGGPNPPYRQTERLDLYRRYAEALLESGRAYRCYCTEEELAAERESLLASGETPRYLGRCRGLAKEDCDRLEREGRRPVIRFRVPENQVIRINDLVRGEVSFECSGIGDFIILKSDGIPTYNFAVVVDDYTMDITHIIRAEEHLSNTPRQVLVYQAFNWPAPEFAHVSLILGKDHSKMSKRHGATSVEQYREKGYLPEACVNFLALLGWSPGGEEEIFSLEEIKEQFSLDRVAKSPAVFDLDKLNWLNGHYIRKAAPENLVDLALPHLIGAGYLSVSEVEARREWLKKVVASVQKYLNYMEEITGYSSIFFVDNVDPADEEAVDVLAGEHVPGVLAALKEKISQDTLKMAAAGAGADQLGEAEAKRLLKEVSKELKLGGKNVFMPVRVALSGSMHGPDLDQIMSILGRAKVVNRLDRALERIRRLP
ncbi:MAG: glutamate--tRNA ligase [Eubacteriales bacterium]